MPENDSRARGIRVSANGLSFKLHLTPKGGHDRIDGWKTGADGEPYLKARVTAAPEKGKANAALIALTAETLAISKSRIAITSGETARLKTIAIDGDPGKLSEALLRLKSAD